MALHIIDQPSSIADQTTSPPGFEPGLTGPKPAVLPLHHGLIGGRPSSNQSRHLAAPGSELPKGPEGVAALVRGLVLVLQAGRTSSCPRPPSSALRPVDTGDFRGSRSANGKAAQVYGRGGRCQISRRSVGRGRQHPPSPADTARTSTNSSCCRTHQVARSDPQVACPPRPEVPPADAPQRGQLDHHHVEQVAGFDDRVASSDPRPQRSRRGARQLAHHHAGQVAGSEGQDGPEQTALLKAQDAEAPRANRPAPRWPALRT